MKKLTTAFGAPALLQDVWFLEKMAHFDREVIPDGVCMPRA
jgi:catalase